MKSLNQQGLTITELTIAVVMAGILAVLIGGISTTFYGATLRTQATSRMVVDSQIILRKIVDELRVSASVADVNTIADTYEPSGGWSTSSDNAILIIRTPVIGSSGQFVIDEDTGEPYLNELVYFAEGRNMYRRVLANPLATENNRQTTCPEAEVGVGCDVPDEELSDDYQELSFLFYDQDDQLTTDTNLARSIDMTINLGRTIFGAPVEIENNIRVTLRN